MERFKFIFLVPGQFVSIYADDEKQAWEKLESRNIYQRARLIKIINRWL